VGGTFAGLLESFEGDCRHVILMHNQVLLIGLCKASSIMPLKSSESATVGNVYSKTRSYSNDEYLKAIRDGLIDTFMAVRKMVTPPVSNL